MEKTSVSNNLKDKKVGSKTNIRECNNTNKHRDTWNFTNSQSCGEDYLSGFSWAPRSYTCSFCKREFRSAQALGGHMNVHRRERARMRLQSPPRDGQYPFLNLNLNPNPKPNIAIPPLVSPPFSNSLPSSASPVLLSSISSSPSASPSEMKKWGMDGTVNYPVSEKGSDLTKKSAKSFFQVKKFDDFMEDDGYKLSEKAGIVRLDFEIGLTDSKEDLDLELRLGYS